MKASPCNNPLVAVVIAVLLIPVLIVVVGWAAASTAIGRPL